MPLPTRMRWSLTRVHPKFHAGYKAMAEAGIDPAELPVTPQDMGDLLARHASYTIAGLHCPDGIGGSDEVLFQLGQLAGLCAALARQYAWPEFRRVNHTHFAVAALALAVRNASQG